MEGENEVKIALYLKELLKRLKSKAGVLEEGEEMIDETSNQSVYFEDFLFLRIAFEFTKMYRNDRCDQYLEVFDSIIPTYDEYSAIFKYMLDNPKRIDNDTYPL